jgi:large subunit ribosomal protein L23
MNNERIYQVLKGPVFSEKAQVLGETAGVQVFKVALDANKLEIKKAVEQLFGVEVVKVNTTITKGKTKRFGRTLGRRSDVKKAYVTLKAGQDVEMVTFTNARLMHRWLKLKNVLVVVITTVTLLLVTLVVVINNTTVSLTLNVTKMAFLL